MFKYPAVGGILGKKKSRKKQEEQGQNSAEAHEKWWRCSFKSKERASARKVSGQRFLKAGVDEN
jgi:hypothetical protein